MWKLKCHFLGGKNLPAMQETQVWPLVLEDALEKGMATHSTTLAWQILWTEVPGGLQSMGSQRVRPNWTTNLSCQRKLVNKTKRSRLTVIENKPVVMHWEKGSTRTGEQEVEATGWKIVSRMHRTTWGIEPISCNNSNWKVTLKNHIKIKKKTGC